MTRTCEFCSAPAEALKLETESVYDDDGSELQFTVRVLVCRRCATHWYDGTEEYPNLLPLS